VAITLVSSADGTLTSSMTLSTHDTGDLIIIGTRRLNNTPPDLPSGWTNIEASGSDTHSIRVGYKIAASSSETSGTWTNAAGIYCHIFRGVNTSDPIGGIGTVSAGSSATGVANGVTFEVTDGTSWAVCCVFGGDLQTAGAFPDVGGLTRRLIVTGTTERAAAFDSNGGVTGWAGDASIPNLNQSTSQYRIIAFEIKAAVAAAGLGWKLAGGRSRLAGRGGLAG
jgi:hypothetical protein